MTERDEQVEAMVARLRAPVDQGGYDGHHQEPFYLRIADMLESLARAYGTEQEMHAAWRKRAEESESELSSCRAELEAERKAREWWEAESRDTLRALTTLAVDDVHHVARLLLNLREQSGRGDPPDKPAPFSIEELNARLAVPSAEPPMVTRGVEPGEPSANARVVAGGA